jgi:hypothetical protein
MIGLLLISGISSLHADKDPTLPELEALLGQRTESKEFQEFVKEHKASESGKFGTGHFSPDDSAYSIRYKSFGGWIRVWSIEIRVEVDGVNWKPYSGDLPAGLKRTDLKRDIDAKLGKSQPVSTNTCIPRHSMEGYTWVVHDLEITIFFNKKSGKIAEIHLFEAAENGAKKNSGEEPPGAGQPATKPAETAPVKDQPATPAPKDGPR